MEQWHKLVSLDQLTVKKIIPFEFDSHSILIVLWQKTPFAIENICTHDGNDLTEGEVSNQGEIICPRHGAKFCLKSGKVTAPPAYEDLQTFPIRVINNIVEVYL